MNEGALNDSVLALTLNRTICRVPRAVEGALSVTERRRRLAFLRLAFLRLASACWGVTCSLNRSLLSRVMTQFRNASPHLIQKKDGELQDPTNWRKQTIKRAKHGLSEQPMVWVEQPSAHLLTAPLPLLHSHRMASVSGECQVSCDVPPLESPPSVWGVSGVL